MPLVPSYAALPSSMTTFAYLREQEILNIVYIGLLVIEALMVFGVIIMALVKRVKVYKQLTYNQLCFLTETLTTALLLDYRPTTMNMDRPSLYRQEPERRCPHCNYYPVHEKEKLCEACQFKLDPEGVKAFLNDGEKNWTMYHLVRQGDLSGRKEFEDDMHARLVREKRCRHLRCAKERTSNYVHCATCRERLMRKGRHELANMKDEEPVAKPNLTNPSKAPLEKKHADSEVPNPREGWVWDDLQAEFVHADRKTYKGNSSPEDMV
ncbi:hypothetical protein FSARC_10710 [Fusarium sarcochroum]|uniref:Uncharacterized protein n=1 Tax=Fusarium sarcochroum TaxID=1208366 RepID=A0A8H4TKB3_9HYPO|nr:hypothetical protein FSARC_10710 [Fusarium sarcochroum]